MTLFRSIAVSILMLAAAGCRDAAISPTINAAASPTINGELAMRYAQTNYDLGPRIFRTEGAKRSAEWIKAEAEKIPGLAEAKGTVRLPGSAQSQDSLVRNVEIAFPGKSDDFIVVGAHHDTKLLSGVPDFAGANDGASGVGALLAMAAATAEYARKTPLPCGIRFVFFDGEEALVRYTDRDGLTGSRDYVNMLRTGGELKRCRAMVLLDMIGDKDLHVELAGNSTRPLADLVLKSAKELGHEDKFSAGETPMIDDHCPFLEAGIPAVDLIDFSFGPDNRYWHTAEDTMDKISAESIRTAADTALRTVWILAGNDFKDLAE